MRERGNGLAVSCRRFPRAFAAIVSGIVAIFVLWASPAGTIPVLAQDFFADLLTGVELTIGESVAQSVISEYGPPARLTPEQQHWIEGIFSDLVAQAKRKEIPYTLQVLDSQVVNAFAAPGGYIFITTGLLGHIGGDTDALANVLGHEVAHVEHKHGMNTIVRQLGMGWVLQLLFGGSDSTLQTVVAVAAELTRLGWSREQEYESDDLGQRLAAAAGYDPWGMVRFFELLQRLEGQEVPFLEFLRTHPLTSERAERARVRARELAGESQHEAGRATMRSSGEAPRALLRSTL